MNGFGTQVPDLAGGHGTGAPRTQETRHTDTHALPFTPHPCTHTFRPLKALQSEWEPLALRFLRAGGTFAEGIQPRQLLFRDELKLFSLPAPRFQRAWGPFPRVRITTQQSHWQRRTTSQEGAGARQARVCVLASRGAWAWCPGRGSGAQEARLFEEVIPRLLDPSLSPLA